MLDWSHMVKTVINAVQAYASSLKEKGVARKPEPDRWNMHYSVILKEEDQKYVFRGKRRVEDSNGVTVAEWLDPATAEYAAAIPPVSLLILMDTIESMAAIIAKYRNSGLRFDTHTAESVRLSVMRHQEKKVLQFVSSQIKAITDIDKNTGKRYGVEISGQIDPADRPPQPVIQTARSKRGQKWRDRYGKKKGKKKS